MFYNPVALTSPGSGIVEEEAVNQFQGQHLVEFGGVVSIPLDMPPYHSLKAFAFDIGPGKGARVEQHFLNIPGEGIPVPNAEMEGLVSSQEDVFEVEGRKGMVKPGQPLWHAHVIRVLSLEQEFEKAPGDCS